MFVVVVSLSFSLQLLPSRKSTTQKSRSAMECAWSISFLVWKAVAVGNKDNEDPTCSDLVWNHQDIRPNLVSHYL